MSNGGRTRGSGSGRWSGSGRRCHGWCLCRDRGGGWRRGWRDRITSCLPVSLTIISDKPAIPNHTAPVSRPVRKFLNHVQLKNPAIRRRRRICAEHFLIFSQTGVPPGHMANIAFPLRLAGTRATSTIVWPSFFNTG